MRKIPAPRLIPAVIAAVLLHACKPAPHTPAARTEAEALQIAEQATSSLMQTLVTELTSAMAEGGPTNAVQVCSNIAQSKTQALGQQLGISIRRVALRTRNDQDVPNARERTKLQEWSALQGQAQPWSESAPSPDGTPFFYYMRPIYLGEKCTACHGPTEQIEPAVLKAIQTHYPNDQATGFQPGDLRGAFSIEIPLVKP